MTEFDADLDFSAVQQTRLPELDPVKVQLCFDLVRTRDDVMAAVLVRRPRPARPSTAETDIGIPVSHG